MKNPLPSFPNIQSFFLLFILFFFRSCTPTLQERITRADKVVEYSDLKKVLVSSGNFVLTTYQKISDKNSPYIFYIDGDGFALWDAHTISDNPTPLNPIVIKLASLDSRPNVIYIARPCQYTDLELNQVCNNNKYWTDSRMSQEVIEVIASAIKKIAKNNEISLIGFSGGGGIAVILGAKLEHIKNIITVAGNLDIIEFADFHKRPRIADSLNPIDFINKVKNIPQLHLAGGKDKVVPIVVTDNFVNAANSKCVKKMIIESATHGKGWDIVWNEILQKRIDCD
jgi:hypothetical protein